MKRPPENKIIKIKVNPPFPCNGILVELAWLDRFLSFHHHYTNKCGTGYNLEFYQSSRPQKAIIYIERLTHGSWAHANERWDDDRRTYCCGPQYQFFPYNIDLYSVNSYSHILRWYYGKWGSSGDSPTGPGSNNKDYYTLSDSCAKRY
jgi:hypothetical protein